jgi:hypothetical protein
MIFVTGDAAQHLETLRRQWDPDMARQVQAHVTVTYPEEVSEPELLRARLHAAASRIPPFPMRLGPVVAHEGKPSRGVYHLVADPVGMWTWLRDFLLAPPFTAFDVIPHASITHPRTTSSGRQAFKELAGADPSLEFRVGELHLTANDGERWVVTESVALRGSPIPAP